MGLFHLCGLQPGPMESTPASNPVVYHHAPEPRTYYRGKSRSSLVETSRHGSAITKRDIDAPAEPERVTTMGAPPERIAPTSGYVKLFGPNHTMAPVDHGFATRKQFSHGDIEVREGKDGISFQEYKKMTAGDRFLAWGSMTTSAVTVLGWRHLWGKITLVKEGELALVRTWDGRMRVLGRGLYLSSTVGPTAVRKHNSNEDYMQLGIFHVVHVVPGKVGLATHNGKPLLLTEGHHMINDALFKFERSADLTDEYIHVSTAHIITVPTDKIGLAIIAGEGHILSPGRHIFNDPVFQFIGFKDSTEPHIGLHSKHRLYVPKGQIALVAVDGQPHMLENGVYCFDAAAFVYKQTADAKTPYLFIHTLHRMYLPEGQIALVMYDGRGELIETPGVHVIDSPTFELKGFEKSTVEFMTVGECSRVLVKAGHVGKLNISGSNELLPPGVHEYRETQNVSYEGSSPRTCVFSLRNGFLNCLNTVHVCLSS